MLAPRPYFTPQGKTIGSSAYAKEGFKDSLSQAMSLGSPQQLGSGSPLVLLVPPGGGPIQTITTPGLSGAQGVTPGDNNTEYQYTAEKVGEIERAPMAMFEHNGELVMSTISRNDMSETPVWTYSKADGVQKRGSLPEWGEGGNFGYSTGGTLHLTPESWGGAVDYTASSPDGPWTKHDYSSMVPHEYKNLKWGFSYQCPDTGRQFLGFGNADKPGMLMSYDSGQWEVLAAPDDMRFPSGMGVIESGPNAGTVLVSSAYNGSQVHAVAPDGTTTKLKSLPGWGILRVDNDSNQAIFADSDNGKVYYASLDDLTNWREARYTKPNGSVGNIEMVGEPIVHPQNGRMLIPAIDQQAGTTGIYEVRQKGGEMVLEQVIWIDGAGQWAGKTAIVGNDLYFGTGKRTGAENDRTPGVIYRIDLSEKEPEALG